MPRRVAPPSLDATFGVVTSEALRALGYRTGYAVDQANAGRWQRVHPATWCAYTGPLSHDSRCAAAVAHAGPAAALDAQTALARYGFSGASGEMVHVVVPYGADVPAADGVRIRRSRTLTERSVVTRRGLPTIRVERAAVTVALASPARARGVLAAVVQQGLTVPSHLRGALLAMGRVHHKRAVLAAIGDIDGGTRSALEQRLVTLARRAGLPPLVQNHPVQVGDRRAWVDACWPAYGIAVEVDGKAYHVLGEDWEDDLDRQNDLDLADWLVLRVTARALRHEPDRVVGWLRSALASRTPADLRCVRSAAALAVAMPHTTGQAGRRERVG
jgi:very-short-patch-repair endonuclease